MVSTTKKGRRLCLAAAAALAVVALAGCGGSQAQASAQDETAQPTPAPRPGGPVTVTAVDYAFQGLPERVKAGTRLELVNQSKAELHELVAFRLPDTEKRPVSELGKLPEEEAMKVVGEPATVLLAPPGGGEQIPAVGDGTLKEPGRYAVICSIPVGTDPDEFLRQAQQSQQGPPPPQPGTGPPHMLKGMFAELTVE